MITLEIPRVPESQNNTSRRITRPFTDADLEHLRIHYAGYAASGKLSELAASMGRTRQFICRKARTLGLTDQNRTKPWLVWRIADKDLQAFVNLHATSSNSEMAVKLGLNKSTLQKQLGRLGLKRDPADKWILNPHPRGMKGKKHSAAIVEGIAERTRQQWADPKSAFNSEIHRQDCSDRASRLQAEGKFRQRYSRARVGKRADLDDQFFRSSWEANYARYLNFLKKQGLILGWEYEPKVFWFEQIKRGARSYTPDFHITETGKSYYVEIKGWMDPKSATKLARMAKYYPEVEIRVIQRSQYRSLAAKMARLLPGWET